jgi:catechol 2,3-dioxygenase-like lactoylglutathione lyase family enzyme
MGVEMSSVEVSDGGAPGSPLVKAGEYKLEVVVLPVSDVDRAKSFYQGLGWRLDADIAPNEDFRLVQLTPPGSACSIQFGISVSSAAPGSAQSLYLAVADLATAREELAMCGRPLPRRRPRSRTGARRRQLLLVRHLQRPGRQRLAAARDRDATPRSLRGGAHGNDVRVRG